MERLDTLTARLERWMLIVLLTVMVVLGLLQIISRFVIKAPIMWSEALLMYMFVWSSFIGASLAVKEFSHFEVEIFVVRLPRMVRKILSLAVYSMIFAFALFMIWKGLFLVKLNQRQLMAMMPFTMSGPYVILPLSGTFIAIHSLNHLREFFSRHHTEWRD
ncbi:MAG: TRAP transporter small permease [Synergistaceae bacterium]|uniref:TRAP transporter small permease n=1 Tax=Aminivibrio sp. TaxID=1872489 RepID=UPI002A1ED0FB|nr:TRAP transporter small permease [Synergistaceae bacterium]MDD3390304.1 TRAP transporter small permease [Synergistaceae bacterium]MDD3688686.1 TRAP transporter small permease [Synergistaceae bacterium]